MRCVLRLLLKDFIVGVLILSEHEVRQRAAAEEQRALVASNGVSGALK